MKKLGKSTVVQLSTVRLKGRRCFIALINSGIISEAATAQMTCSIVPSQNAPRDLCRCSFLLYTPSPTKTLWGRAGVLYCKSFGMTDDRAHSKVVGGGFF